MGYLFVVCDEAHLSEYIAKAKTIENEEYGYDAGAEVDYRKVTINRRCK
jgi:hypothetical protein